MHGAAAHSGAERGPNLHSGFASHDARTSVARLVAFDAGWSMTNMAPAMQQQLISLRRMAGFSLPLTAVWHAMAVSLCDPERESRLANPTVMAAGVDLNTTTGALDAVISGDCEVWAQTDGEWSSLAPDDMLTAAGRAALDARLRDASSDGARRQSYLDVLDDPGAWARPPLGYVAMPSPARIKVDRVDGVVVATAGAELTPERCADLSAWLDSGMHAGSTNRPDTHPHGDLWVASLSR